MENVFLMGSGLSVARGVCAYDETEMLCMEDIQGKHKDMDFVKSSAGR